MSTPVNVTSTQDATTVALRSRVPPASNAFTNVQLPSVPTGPMSPMPPPKLKRTVTCTSSVPCSGEPSGRTVGHVPVDENVAATPSAIDDGLDHLRFEGGVQMPALSQCAGAAPAPGRLKHSAASIAKMR